MKINNTTFLISAAALAILGLIAIQLVWMQHSRKLLEEQFNNRVNMALCSTVEKMAANQASTDQVRACCQEGNNSGCAKTFDDLQQMPEMRAALTQSLQFYQVELPHSILITRKDSGVSCSDNMPFSCSLTPIMADDSHVLQLRFENKEDYIAAKMGMMTALSIAILALISAVFALASFYLLRQKKMSDLNRDFFNHMTHEFRTPLTNIRLAGTMFARKNPAFADNPYLVIIRKECQQLTEQVENVLHLASLEKGDYQLKKETLQLNKVLHDTIEQMDIQIRDRAADVQLDIHSAPLTVQGDPFHLSNAFRNLLDNALKYNLDRPEVRIGVEELKDYVKISFRDNGIGLSEKDQQRIFDKFQRCTDNACELPKGFGLGLAYVKKIMDLHGGRIEVASHEGQGTRFDLYLPHV